MTSGKCLLYISENTGLLFYLGLCVIFLSMYIDTGSNNLEKQPKDLLVAALFILFGAVLALPQVYGRMSKMIKIVLLVLVFSCSGYLGYAVYNSIDSEMEMQAYCNMSKLHFMGSTAVAVLYRLATDHSCNVRASILSGK